MASGIFTRTLSDEDLTHLISTYEASFGIRPRTMESCIALAETKLSFREYAMAFLAIYEAIARGCKDAVVHTKYDDLFVLLNNPANVLAMLNGLVAKGIEPLYWVRARAYCLNGQYEFAQHDLEKLLSLDKSYETQHHFCLMLGSCYLHTKNFTAALKILEQAAALSHFKHTYTLYQLAQAHDRLGNTHDAINLYGKVLELAPKFYPALYRQKELCGLHPVLDMVRVHDPSAEPKFCRGADAPDYGRPKIAGLFSPSPKSRPMFSRFEEETDLKHS